jgi:hypothetical protein
MAVVRVVGRRRCRLSKLWGETLRMISTLTSPVSDDVTLVL